MKILMSSALAVFFVLAAGVSEGFACSCLAPPSLPDAFTASPILVTAKIDGFEELYRTVAAVMTVEKAYKGVLKAGQTMRVLNGGGGDCSMAFERESVGQRFLFFTDPAKQIGSLKGKLHWISLCSRSSRIETAGPNLNYLDNRAKLTGKTRLSGTIKRFSP